MFLAQALNSIKNIEYELGLIKATIVYGTRVSSVTDSGCIACRYDLTEEIRTQTDTGQLQLELWSQEDIVLDP